MKRLLRFSLFFFIAVAARADVLLEQTLDSQLFKGNTTLKIKADQARMDLPGGSITILMNLKSGEMSTLVHREKTALKMTLADAKKIAETQQKGVGLDLSKIEKPKPTGQREKVGDWDCEIFALNSGGLTGKLWVAKDFPKTALEEIQRANAAAAGGLGFDFHQLDLGGMTVKSEVNLPSGKTTATVVKVSEEAVAETEFALPAGYKDVPMPGVK